MNISHTTIKQPHNCKFWMDGYCYLLSKKCNEVCSKWEKKDGRLK